MVLHIQFSKLYKISKNWEFPSTTKEILLNSVTFYECKVEVHGIDDILLSTSINAYKPIFTPTIYNLHSDKGRSDMLTSS